MPLEPLPITAILLSYQKVQRLVVWRFYSTYRPVISFIPISAMEKLSLELREARDDRPFPVIQCSGTRNQKIARVVVYGAAGDVLDLLLCKSLLF
jgi:hypothetical protein